MGKQLAQVKTENGIGTLYVDGKPFICLGGELFNSSCSSTEWMREHVWPKLRPMNLNSIVATVSWEQIEPEKGVFCFDELDDLIADAEKEGVYLTLIWFGLWKNGASSYVPEWVKLDRKNYWVCGGTDATHIPSWFGEPSFNTISPLCEKAVQADAKAFAKLMAHIRETDKNGMVIMMQVENEIGLLGSPRDYSPLANELFASEIPEKVAAEFGVGGTWKDAFGPDAEEYFMAWHYGCAVEQIASAGTTEHPLPMYVNAWLQQHPDRAGSYPSGGPIAKMMRMWRLAAPTICMYAPDIYVPDFEQVVAEYSQNGNPLFIPETSTHVRSTATVFLAVCEYNAIGFNPFGVESIFGTPRELDSGFLAGLNIADSAFSSENTAQYLPESYKLLGSMMHLIVPARGTGRLRGFYHYSADAGCLLHFDEYDVHITYGATQQGKPPAGGAVLQVSENEFYVFGVNFRAQFLPKNGERLRVEPLRIEEGRFEGGKWIRGRILNGDEQRVSLPYQPGVVRIKLYKY